MRCSLATPNFVARKGNTHERDAVRDNDVVESNQSCLLQDLVGKQVVAKDTLNNIVISYMLKLGTYDFKCHIQEKADAKCPF